MRIHRVKLNDYRAVVEREVNFAESGVTIVEGDNEIGKTSLMEAFDLILEYPDSSKAGAVEAVKPVDRDAGAQVEVEVTTGEYRFVYSKRWHRKAQTTLEVLEPAREQLTGRAAHDRVRAILSETLDEELWSALRLSQGVELGQTRFDVASLGQALDQAAGAALGGEREDNLWSRIEEERARYWTATGKAKADRASLARALHDADEKVAALEAELRELEADADEVERLGAEAADLAERARQAERERSDLATRVDEVERIRSDVARLTAEHDAANARREQCVQALARRTELVEEVARRGAAVASHEQDLERSRPALATAAQREADAQRALQDAIGVFEAAESDHRVASDDVEYRRKQIEKEQLTERRDRVADAQRRLSEAQGRLDSARVDDALMERIQAAHLEVAKAEAAFQSGAAAVETIALDDVQVEIDGTSHRLTAGETHQLVVSTGAEILLPGSLRVTVRAGGEAQDLAHRLHEARSNLSRLCESGGVVDFVEASERVEERKNAERVVADASAAIRRDLRDLTTETLAGKVTRLAEWIADYEARRPATPPVPPDLDAAQDRERELAGALDRARAARDACRDEADTARQAVADAQVGEVAAATRLEHERVTLSEAEQSLASARAAASDESLDEALVGARRDCERLRDSLETAEANLEAKDPDTVGTLLDNARDKAARLAEAQRLNAERTRELRIKLELKGEEGIAHELDTARTEVEHLRREHEQLETRAEAARLLHETFETRRDESRNRLVAPFREKVEKLGRIVFGSTLEVELDEDLRIARRTLDGVTVDFEQLSTGAREQLEIIARLACAAIVSPGGGAPVVFDDSLGWTDPGRLERMGATIATAGKECQVIVLTCTPGRYAAVGNATVVSLAG